MRSNTFVVKSIYRVLKKFAIKNKVTLFVSIFSSWLDKAALFIFLFFQSFWLNRWRKTNLILKFHSERFVFSFLSIQLQVRTLLRTFLQGKVKNGPKFCFFWVKEENNFIGFQILNRQIKLSFFPLSLSPFFVILSFFLTISFSISLSLFLSHYLFLTLSFSFFRSLNFSCSFSFSLSLSLFLTLLTSLAFFSYSHSITILLSRSLFLKCPDE